jgi:hypothetical protein
VTSIRVMIVRDDNPMIKRRNLTPQHELFTWPASHRPARAAIFAGSEQRSPALTPEATTLLDWQPAGGRVENGPPGPGRRARGAARGRQMKVRTADSDAGAITTSEASRASRGRGRSSPCSSGPGASGYQYQLEHGPGPAGQPPPGPCQCVL